MTKLEREKYLLALNDPQRLFLLLTLGLHLERGNALDLTTFEDFMRAYKPKEKEL